MSHDLSHSHTRLLEFQINLSSIIPLSINYLHSLLHLSFFQHCLLLQTLVSNLDIRLNTLIFMFLTTSGTHNFAYESLILLQLRQHFFYFNTVKIK